MYQSYDKPSPHYKSAISVLQVLLELSSYSYSHTASK